MGLHPWSVIRQIAGMNCHYTSCFHSSARINASAFADLGLIEHTNGLGWLHSAVSATRMPSSKRKHAPDCPARVLHRGLDHVSVRANSLRDVEDGEHHRDRQEDRGVGEVEAWKTVSTSGN